MRRFTGPSTRVHANGTLFKLTFADTGAHGCELYRAPGRSIGVSNRDPVLGANPVVLRHIYRHTSPTQMPNANLTGLKLRHAAPRKPSLAASFSSWESE